MRFKLDSSIILSVIALAAMRIGTRRMRRTTKMGRLSIEVKRPVEAQREVEAQSKALGGA